MSLFTRVLVKQTGPLPHDPNANIHRSDVAHGAWALPLGVQAQWQDRRKRLCRSAPPPRRRRRRSRELSRGGDASAATPLQPSTNAPPDRTH